MGTVWKGWRTGYSGGLRVIRNVVGWNYASYGGRETLRINWRVDLEVEQQSLHGNWMRIARMARRRYGVATP